MIITRSIFRALDSVQSLPFRCHTFRVKLSELHVPFEATSQVQGCLSTDILQVSVQVISTKYVSRCLIQEQKAQSDSSQCISYGKTELVAKRYACVLRLTGQAHLKANVLGPVVYLKREKQKHWDDLVNTSERQVNLLLSIWVAHRAVAMVQD